MKSGEEESLREALGRWRVDQPLPPRFRENVWQRIAAAEGARAPSLGEMWRGWLASALGQRRVALSYITLALALGVALGYEHGRAEGRAVEAQLAERYARSVAPYPLRP